MISLILYKYYKKNKANEKEFLFNETYEATTTTTTKPEKQNLNVKIVFC